MPSTDGYAEAAATLLADYEAMRFEAIHAGILDLLPEPPAEVLDIGAGSGRDAGWLAAQGYRVTAAEPVAEMREGARRLHPSPAIRWCDDALPELPALSLGRTRFDLILMTAVFMHLDAEERAAALPVLAGLLAPGGRLILSLRHGPVPADRQMFEVGAEEIRALAAAAGLGVIRERTEAPALPRNVAAGVRWTRIALARPDAA
ncbi:class I SAM-dependent methyltransferase [Solirhodobacter olei]|uniref:class I SAM-dependent methyltransferase n=1 Tax=Solirhodobacter olei TaxID=2493082 RepID=UPI000FDBEBA8|nr:class I SAM-dependent methyltransferase [Solirhodobacter olei]